MPPVPEVGAAGGEAYLCHGRCLGHPGPRHAGHRIIQIAGREGAVAALSPAAVLSPAGRRTGPAPRTLPHDPGTALASALPARRAGGLPGRCCCPSVASGLPRPFLPVFRSYRVAPPDRLPGLPTRVSSPPVKPVVQLLPTTIIPAPWGRPRRPRLRTHFVRSARALRRRRPRGRRAPQTIGLEVCTG